MSEETMKMNIGLLTGQRKGDAVDLGTNGATIGRDSENDITLDEDGVSRYHARIFVKDSAWAIEDSGSTNGVYVNDKRISEACTLNNGDRIRIYNQQMVFGDEGTVRKAVAATRSTTTQKAKPRRRSPAHKSSPSRLSGQSAAGGASVGPASGSTSADVGFWLRVALFVCMIGGLIYLGILTFSSEPATPSGDDRGNGAIITDSAKGKAHEQAEGTEGVATLSGQSDGAPSVSGAPESGTDSAQAAENTADDESEKGGAGKTAESSVPAGTAAGGQGNFQIVTRPAGAEVFIDDVRVARSPVTIPALSEGRHRIRLEKEGFETLVRQFTVPDPDLSAPYELRLNPGVVYVTSTPIGAAIIRGNQILGRTPEVLTGLPLGKTDITLAAVGYESKTVSVDVVRVEGKKVEVQLEPKFGALEIVSSPPGCKVFVDDRFKGETKASDSNSAKSRPLRVAGLPVGERVIKVKHPGGRSQTRVVKVRPEETIAVPTVKVWVIDTKLILDDGDTVQGKFIDQNEAGDVVLELVPGEMKRYLEPEYKKLVRLDAEGAQKAMAEWEEKMNGRNEASGGSDNGNGVKRFTTAQLKKMMKREPEAFYDRVKERRVVVSGVPQDVQHNGEMGLVMLGGEARCFLSSDQFRDAEERLSNAQAESGEVSITGEVMGFNEEAKHLLLRNSRVVTE